jgi:hypothetical protein
LQRANAARDVAAVRTAAAALWRWLERARLDPVLYLGARPLLDAASTLLSGGTGDGDAEMAWRLYEATTAGSPPFTDVWLVAARELQCRAVVLT